MTVPILALDLATATGWALLDRAGVLTSGVQRFALRRGESAGMRTLRLGAWLAEVVTEGCLLAYEKPIGRHRGQAAASVAYSFECKVLEAAALFRLETLPVTAGDVKKLATGKGNAGKPAVVAAAGKRWPSVTIEDDNHADALWVLAWACREIGIECP